MVHWDGKGSARHTGVGLGCYTGVLTFTHGPAALSIDHVFIYYSSSRNANPGAGHAHIPAWDHGTSSSRAGRITMVCGLCVYAIAFRVDM